MLYKNFIWDFDGTIIDTYPATINSILKTMKEYNVNLNYEEVYKKAKVTLRYVFDYIKNEYNFNNEIVDKILYDFSKISPKDRIKYDKIEEVLIYIKKNDGKNFLVTNRDSKSTLDILDFYNLKYLFEEIVTSDDGFKLKPNPESFNFLINKYSLSLNKTIGIGDRKLDIEAAKNSNIASVFMNFDIIKSNYNADFVFNNYNDFYKNILMRWSNGHKWKDFRRVKR